MWTYDKKLQYPVKIKNTNPAMAKIIMTQLGGPDSIRYESALFFLLSHYLYSIYKVCSCFLNTILLIRKCAVLYLISIGISSLVSKV